MTVSSTTERLCTINVKGRSKQGKEMYIVAYISRSRDAVGARLCTILCHHITQLVGKAEELEIQKRILLQFAHEMRNKYTPACSMLEQILSSLSKQHPELRDCEDDIKSSIALLREADTLLATRLELHHVYSGRYDSASNTVSRDVRKLMAACVEDVRGLAPRTVAFKVLVPDRYADLVVLVSLDVHVFTHIASSLLFNARKHTLVGTVELRFLDIVEPGFVDFAVADTGTGMPQEIVSRLVRRCVCVCRCHRKLRSSRRAS